MVGRGRVRSKQHILGQALKVIFDTFALAVCRKKKDGTRIFGINTDLRAKMGKKLVFIWVKISLF
jgi:hypothetical protein